MNTLLSPSFQNDQYFILNKRNFDVSLSEIERIVKEEQISNEPFEKVTIPEDQINGAIHKIDYSAFEKVNEYFAKGFKHIIEKETCLTDLELVAVRRNILRENDSVSMHKDFEGYVIIIDIPRPPIPEENNEEETEEKNRGLTVELKKPFEGGNILFTKDSGEVVEIELKSDELFVAKCTNNHGVQKVLSGTRESIALFSRPKA
jgi:hypothetical protein